jgi:hypothetical protein
VQEFAFANPSEEFVDAVKSVKLSESGAGTTEEKMAQLKEMLLPKQKEDEEDSDFNFSDSEEISSTTTSATSSGSGPALIPKSEYFASAESVTFDDLIEDIDYVDLNNMKEVKQLYERMKGKVRKGIK